MHKRLPLTYFIKPSRLLEAPEAYHGGWPGIQVFKADKFRRSHMGFGVYMTTSAEDASEYAFPTLYKLFIPEDLVLLKYNGLINLSKTSAILNEIKKELNITFDEEFPCPYKDIMFALMKKHKGDSENPDRYTTEYLKSKGIEGTYSVNTRTRAITFCIFNPNKVKIISSEDLQGKASPY